MTRIEEIRIIIEHLIYEIHEDVIKNGINETTIIKNGKLLEYYRDELKKIEF